MCITLVIVLGIFYLIDNSVMWLGAYIYIYIVDIGHCQGAELHKVKGAVTHIVHYVHALTTSPGVLTSSVGYQSQVFRNSLGTRL